MLSYTRKWIEKRKTDTLLTPNKMNTNILFESSPGSKEYRENPIKRHGEIFLNGKAEKLTAYL